MFYKTYEEKKNLERKMHCIALYWVCFFLFCHSSLKWNLFYIKKGGSTTNTPAAVLRSTTFYIILYDYGFSNGKAILVT